VKNSFKALCAASFLFVSVASADTTSGSLDKYIKFAECKQLETGLQVDFDRTISVEAGKRLTTQLRQAIIDSNVATVDSVITAADIRSIRKALAEKGDMTAYNDDLYYFQFLGLVRCGIPLFDYSEALAFYTNFFKGFSADNKVKAATMDRLAYFATTLLKREMKAGKLKNPEYTKITGTTGTSLDRMIPYIFNDKGLQRKVPFHHIEEAAIAANDLNILLVRAIKETNVAKNANISADEIGILNRYICENFGEEWRTAHGLNQGNNETGFHRIQDKGSYGYMRGQNTITSIGDSIYHLGYVTGYSKNLVNENGNKNASFQAVSFWLNSSLKKDMKAGLFTQE